MANKSCLRVKRRTAYPSFPAASAAMLAGASVLVALSGKAARAQIVQNTSFYGPGQIYSTSALNNLVNGTVATEFHNAEFNDGTDHTDVNYQDKPGTGTIEVSHNILPAGGPPGGFGNPSASASTDAIAGSAASTLKNYAYGESTGKDSGTTSGVDAILGDTLTFSKATTVTVNGVLEGNLSATGGAGVTANFYLLLVDPNNQPFQGEVNIFGGEATALSLYPAGLGGAQILPHSSGTLTQYPISFTVNLPAGAVYVYSELDSQVNTETQQSGGMYYGSSGEADFSHTFNYSIIVPNDVTVTSAAGLVSVSHLSDVSAPEPVSAAYSMAGVLSLAGFALRRQTRAEKSR